MSSPEAPPLPPPGTFGPLVAVAHLGTGGFGTVFRVRHATTNVEYALKVIRSDVFDQETLQRFGREMQVLGALSHPGIVRVHGAGRTPRGEPYYVMELLEGSPLTHALRTRRRFEPREAAALVAKVARAIGSAHARGIVHRDLKPDNIFMEARTGEPRIVDFGLATAERSDFQRLTKTGDMLGTPAFMAPEQALSEKITPATDVWSLGVVLFNLVTGRLPFEGATALVLMQAILTRPPLLPTAVSKELPVEIDEIFLRCCERKPEMRYASGVELAVDLEAFVRGEPVSAQGRAAARRLAVLRQRLLYAAAGVVATVAIGVGVSVIAASKRGLEHGAHLAAEESAAAARVREDLDRFDGHKVPLDELVPIARRLDAASLPAGIDETTRRRFEAARPFAALLLRPARDASAAWDAAKLEGSKGAVLLVGAELAVAAGEPVLARDRLAAIDALSAPERDAAAAKRREIEGAILVAAARAETTPARRAEAALHALESGLPRARLPESLELDLRAERARLEREARALLCEIAKDERRPLDAVAPLRARLARVEGWLDKLGISFERWRGVEVLLRCEKPPLSAETLALAGLVGDARLGMVHEAQVHALAGARDEALRTYDAALALPGEHDEAFMQAWKEAYVLTLESGRPDELDARLRLLQDDDRVATYYVLARSWEALVRRSESDLRAALANLEQLQRAAAQNAEIAHSPVVGEAWLLHALVGLALRPQDLGAARHDLDAALRHEATPLGVRVQALALRNALR